MHGDCQESNKGDPVTKRDKLIMELAPWWAVILLAELFIWAMFFNTFPLGIMLATTGIYSILVVGLLISQMTFWPWEKEEPKKWWEA